MPRAAHVVLGVERNATKDEVRAAFMAKAKRLHPDKSPHSTEATHEAFVELQASYEALTKERQGRLRFFCESFPTALPLSFFPRSAVRSPEFKGEVGWFTAPATQNRRRSSSGGRA